MDQIMAVFLIPFSGIQGDVCLGMSIWDDPVIDMLLCLCFTLERLYPGICMHVICCVDLS